MIERIRDCRRCGLCQNQLPLTQGGVNRADVMFVGLSAVKTDCVDSDEPLSQTTRSGQLIREIAGDLGEVGSYFTNLVKCLPLKDGRIRYPSQFELKACQSNLQLELDQLAPRKVVLLGSQVSEFVIDQLGLKFDRSYRRFPSSVWQSDMTEFLSIHHPSYVLIYRRKDLKAYKRVIREFLRRPSRVTQRQRAA